MADDKEDNVIFVTGNKKKDNFFLTRTTKSLKEKGKYNFPGNDKVM
jgi:hypothetical protein